MYLLRPQPRLLGQPGLLTRAMRDGEVVEDLELAYRRDDGRWRTILTSAAPVLGDDGTVVAAVAVLEDISDRVISQKLIAGQRDVMSMIARGEPLEAMLTELVRVVEGISQRGAIGSILLVSPDRQHLDRRVRAEPSGCLQRGDRRHPRSARASARAGPRPTGASR